MLGKRIVRVEGHARRSYPVVLEDQVVVVRRYPIRILGRTHTAHGENQPKVRGQSHPLTLHHVSI